MEGGERRSYCSDRQKGFSLLYMLISTGSGWKYEYENARVEAEAAGLLQWNG